MNPKKEVTEDHSSASIQILPPQPLSFWLGSCSLTDLRFHAQLVPSYRHILVISVSQSAPSTHGVVSGKYNSDENEDSD